MRPSVTTSRLDDHGTWIVTLHGDHDLASRQQLAEQTDPVWAVCQAAIIDLSAAGFIDSGVIRWLLDVERQLEEAGAFTFSVVEGQPGSVADRIFRHLRMPHVFACYPTLAEARTQVLDGNRRIRQTA